MGRGRHLGCPKIRWDGQNISGQPRFHNTLTSALHGSRSFAECLQALTHLNTRYLATASNQTYCWLRRFCAQLFSPCPSMRCLLSLNYRFSFAALHDLDPAFRSFSRSEEVAAVMASLGYKRPLPVQSMYIFKVSLPAELLGTCACTLESKVVHQ
jgi:hypothetical protein